MGQRISTHKLAGGMDSAQTVIRVGGLVIGFGIALALGCGPAAADDSTSGTSASSDSSTPSSSDSTTSAAGTTTTNADSEPALNRDGKFISWARVGLSDPPASVDADTSSTTPDSSTDNGAAVKVGSAPTDTVGNGRQPGDPTSSAYSANPSGVAITPGGEYAYSASDSGGGGGAGMGGAIYNQGQIGLTLDTSP